MNRDLLYRANQFSKEAQKKRRHKKIMATLSAFVAFCTLNALMLPAITMEKQAICGYDEHTHNDKCYSVVSTPEYFGVSGIHQHTERCYSEGFLSCGIATTVVHTHNELCYDSLNYRTCPLVEITAHTHSEECFNKKFWIKALKTGIVINGICYQIGNENERGFRGFDGRPFKIQLDNGDIYYTTNLWYNGKIPKEYYKGDNARFVK